MTTNYPPLAEVRRGFTVDWYRCPIDRDKLRRLTRRSDFKGLLQAGGHITLIAITGTLTYLLFVQQMWAAFAALLWLHGSFYSFIPGLVTHELSHGTVFKTKWLNEFFLRFFSLVGWVNFHHYKRSHTFHHMYTLHPRGDREVVLPRDASLRWYRLLFLLTFNAPGFVDIVGGMFYVAFTGRFRGKWNPEWSEAIFADADEERKKAVNWARLVVSFHLSLLVVSLLLGLWILPVIVSLGAFVGNAWRYFVGLPMHAGLRDNIADFRKCTRTISLDPLSRFLYWHMNFHIEHHMYAATPCYNLGALAEELAWDMPKQRTLVGAWKEMRYTWKRQKTEPSYQFDTPVPNEAGTRPAGGGIKNTDDDAATSLGELELRE